MMDQYAFNVSAARVMSLICSSSEQLTLLKLSAACGSDWFATRSRRVPFPLTPLTLFTPHLVLQDGRPNEWDETRGRAGL